jgi:thymidylate synthase (FAD)
MLPLLDLELPMLMRETDGWICREFDTVEYLDHMGDDNSVVDAARVSFHKTADTFSDDANTKLIGYLAKHNHWSPFAHTSIKFRFRAPIFVARQFVKHQVGFAWNEVSRRYVSDDPWFFVPDSWRRRPDNMKQGSTFENEVKIRPETPSGNTEKKFIFKMREHNQDYRHMMGQKICPEQARMVMPQNMQTEWIWTGSLVAWARFVNLRADSHSQAECWPYAEAVATELRRLFPVSFQALKEQP